MAAQKPTYYQVLMVDPGVDDDVLTAVHTRLVERARGADAGGRNRERLEAIEEAYGVLHDRERRRRYDLEQAYASDRHAVPVTSGPPSVITIGSARSGVDAVRAPVLTGSARVLDFGRYAGWSLRQVAMRDRDYLEWLRRAPGGRQYRAEIAAILDPR